MNTDELLTNAVNLVANATNLSDLELLESKLKDLIKSRKEDFKAETKANEKAAKEKAKVELQAKMTEADIGKIVRYTFGSGKNKETREGKLLRVPSADHPTFSVEVTNEDGSTKKLPRNATAFIGFAA